jgi:type II secretory pathway component PulM
MAVSLSRPYAPAAVVRWLAGKSKGERRTVAVILIVAVLSLSWVAIWQPLTRDSATLRAARADSAGALAAARRMSDEIAGLERTAAAPAPAASDLRGALERVLAQQDLRSAVTQLDWQDGRARLVLAAVRYDPLMFALEALQRDAQLRAVEVSLTARVEPGTVRAEITLAR